MATATKKTSSIAKDAKANNWNAQQTQNAINAQAVRFGTAGTKVSTPTTPTASAVKMSKGGTGFEKAIDANVIKNATPIKMPDTSAVNTSTIPTIDVTNSSISNPLDGITTDKGIIQYDPTKTAAQNQADMSQGTLSTILSALGYAKPQDAQANEKAMKNSMKESGYTQAQKDVALYSGQINAITNQRDAQILSLEGQGRGQTTQFLGGEQARIQREAAIQAMPAQAQLAAAQGNLEAAKGIMGMLYQAKSADIQAQASYRQSVANAVIGYATADQAARMQAGLADRQREDTIRLSNVNYLRDLSNKAIEYGNTGALSALGNIDPASPTFEADVAGAARLIQKPISATESKPITQLIGDTLYQYDSTTGTWNPVAGAGSGGATGSPADLLKTGTVNDIEKIISLSDAQLQENLGLRNVLQRNTPGTSEYQFAIQHNNLINQLALAARGQLKGQGSVSDFEGNILKSAQTTLNLYMDPAAYRKEAKQVAGAINTSSGIPQYVSVKSLDGKETRYAVLDSQSIQEAVNQGYVIEYQ